MNVTYPDLGHVGRLGNQLWQIASTVGIARQHGLEPVFPAWDYRPFFSMPDHMFGHVGSARNVLEFFEDDERYKAYMQNLALFESSQEEVKKLFAPSPQALTEMEPHLSITEGATSLHVRRGDNLRELTSNNGWHTLTPVSYYQEAVKLAGGPILIFSDDIPWCEEVLAPQLPADEIRFFRGTPRPDVPGGYWNAPASDWIDMQLMALCPRHITANSTYSWWGAFLSDDKFVIHPECWYGYRISYIPWRRMIPETWRGIKC